MPSGGSLQLQRRLRPRHQFTQVILEVKPREVKSPVEERRDIAY
jgi:hypothetical protein